MVFFEPDLCLHVQQPETGLKPFPMQTGFSNGCAYRALGLSNPSETTAVAQTGART